MLLNHFKKRDGKKERSPVSAPVRTPHGVSACGYLTTLFRSGILPPKNVFIDLYLTEEIKAPAEAVTLNRTAFFD